MNMVTPFDAAPVPLRFDIEQFVRLAHEGMFEDFAKAELIEGEIFVVNAQFRRHAWARRQLVRAFDTALGDRDDNLTAADECSVALSPDTMPEPDIVLTTEPRGDGPIPLSSVRLIVEIADTTLANDLGRKVALYAAYGVAEYWVVDLDGCAIHQFWSCAREAYRERSRFAIGDRVTLVTLAGIEVETAGLI